MNPNQPFAFVSALDHPLQHTLQKRQFQPASGTIFGDLRRRKLENGVQPIQSRFLNTTSPDFNNSYKNSFKTNTFAEPRPKFKARPIPKSLYQPHILQKNPEKNTSGPGFSLNYSPVDRKGEFANSNSFKTKSEKFKARPMPNFSSPWTAQSYSTPVKQGGERFQFGGTPMMFEFGEFGSPKKAHGRSVSGSGEIVERIVKDFEPTVPMEIDLHSTKRAQDREIFQERLREISRIREAERKEQEDKRLKREEEELRMIRKQTEFKAKPMPKFQRVLEWSKEKNLDLSTDFLSTNDTMMDIE